MSAASKDDISRRAYAIWESEGCPEGRAVDHWLRAETELAAMTPAAKRSPKTRETTQRQIRKGVASRR
jgi:hypothetical protein